MADVERGGRIKARREALHLTQPAVVERMEELAWELPLDHALHPVKAAKAEGKGEAAKMPITLRGYQGYEKGGGIVWAKAKLLAQALRMDPHELMHGTSEDERDATPTPFAGQDALADRLDAIEQAIADARAEREEQASRIEGLLKRQDTILERIEAAIDREDEAAARRDAESARLLAEAVQQALRALEDDAQETG